MASATASQHPDRKLSLLVRRVESLPIRMDKSVRNPVPTRQLGNAHIDLAYTTHIRIQTRIQVGESVLAMPIHPRCIGGTRLAGSLAHYDDQSRAGARETKFCKGAPAAPRMPSPTPA